MNHTNMNPSLAGFRQYLVVLAQPLAPAQPCQSAFHHPPARQHPTPSDSGPRYQPAGIGRIGPYHPEPVGPACQFSQDRLGSTPVLDVGGVNHYGEKQPHGVHYDVALAPGDFFTCVITGRPPFSVAFTDWPSTMAALGVAPRPSASLIKGRNTSSTRSQVPSLRHLRKYHQTVPQGTSHSASCARLCPRVTHTVCRLPLPAGPRFENAPWHCPQAARALASPIGHRSNRWDTLFVPVPKGSDYPIVNQALNIQV